MNIENRLYKIKFDGDILTYKSTTIFGLLSAPFGYQRKMELPLNILLHYKQRSFLVFSSFRLCVNQYQSGQKKPKPLLLRKIFLLTTSKGYNHKLLALMNQMIERNLSGESNLALSHMDKMEVERFYSGLHMVKNINTCSRVALKPSTVRLLLPQAVSKTG